jgi:3-deoxy-7-phosphoheptulonate synthase
LHHLVCHRRTHHRIANTPRNGKRFKLVGFKNGTDGGLAVAINALKSVSQPHRFLGIDSRGQVAVITTTGNKYAHIVLRGGSNGPNYDSVHIKLCEQELEKAKIRPNIMVDCSHANSDKKPELQPLVIENVTNQVLEGNKSIVGLMVESNLFAGNQSIPDDLSKLQYGVSVTDGCIGWESTETALRAMREKLKGVLAKR